MTFHRTDVNFSAGYRGQCQQLIAIACPAVGLRVWGNVYQTAPDLAVRRRKVTMMMWLNGIRLTETQVGDLVFAPERSGAV